MSIHAVFRAALLGVLLTCTARANDWIFNYGPYTGNPETGQRVEQYQKPKVAKRVPYDKFFSSDGPHPYIPYWYYQDELGWPGMYGGGLGFGSVPLYGGGISSPYGYVGPYGF